MSIFKKYELYIEIIKQEPVDLSVKKTVCYTDPQQPIIEYIDYKTSDYKIYTVRKKLSDEPVKNFLLKLFLLDFSYNCSAFITNKDEALATFNSLLAKRLFKHGKQHEK